MANQLAKLLAQGLGGQTLIGFGDLALLVVASGTRTPGALSAGANPTETSYPCKGRLGSKSSTVVVNGSLVRVARQVISILGATLTDGIAPKVGDKIVRSGVTYLITSDGVSNADGLGGVFDCSVRVLGG